jgi:hypothetical protein
MAAAAAASKNEAERMSKPFDPFDSLGDLNPVKPGELRGASSTPEAQDALKRIVAGRHTGPRQLRHLRNRRRWRRGAVVALIPVAAALAVTAWALTQGPAKQLTVGCYEAADLRARTVVVPAGETTPAQACAAVWRRGDFGTGRRPTLQECLLSSGAVGVFPATAGDVCRRLELTPLSTVPPPQRPASAAKLKEALVAKFLTKKCMKEAAAVAGVRTELRRFHVVGWRVRVEGHFTATRQCSGLGFDEEKRIVLLVPMPERK